MTPEMKRLLEVLAKYRVSLPVGALVELGLVDDIPPGMTLAEMRRVAERGGLVQWDHSGIVEQVTVSTTNPAGFVARGYYTRVHYLAPRPTYLCQPFEGARTKFPAAGDPSKVHPGFLYDTYKVQVSPPRA